jgi:two-component system phosphate regulon sensor histidine kinase PhoR
MAYMNKNPFKKELSYGLAFLLLATISGLLTARWSWSFLLWTLIYVLWKWIELLHFYRWYDQGADKEKTPLNHGVWQDFSSLVLHNKNKNKKVEKRNQYLLNQFKTMAQAMPYATVLLNKRFEIVWANQSSVQILNIIDPKDRSYRIDNIIRDPSFKKLLTDKLQESEVNIPHPNDINKRIHIKLVKLSNKRYLLVARDISEQDALRQSRKAFVDNASHELRTPLTVITGYLEMMQNAQDIPQSWHQSIAQAQQQSGRMEKIINDMLKLSSIEHEHYLEDNDEVIEMPQLLNRLINDVKNSSMAKRHHFSANIDSALKIIGNEGEITSICLNLLNNAVIHTKEGSTISLRWFKQDEKAQLWVCDDGEGIDAKHLPHLSERFYRVDNARNKNTNSTGLGLAIVKQICDNHDAVLSIESEPEKHTVFKIEFPTTRIKSYGK